MPNGLQSAIFEGTVRHRRLGARPHEFSYKVFMMYLDLAELDRVFTGTAFWSAQLLIAKPLFRDTPRIGLPTLLQGPR